MIIASSSSQMLPDRFDRVSTLRKHTSLVLQHPQPLRHTKESLVTHRNLASAQSEAEKAAAAAAEKAAAAAAEKAKAEVRSQTDTMDVRCWLAGASRGQ